ncbi:hypothetical protein HDU76_006001, partial [Blyttiomyces sp. JEL0837]
MSTDVMEHPTSTNPQQVRELVLAKRWFEGGKITVNDDVKQENELEVPTTTLRSDIENIASAMNLHGNRGLVSAIKLLLVGFPEDQERDFRKLWLFPSIRKPATYLSLLLIGPLAFSYGYNDSVLPAILDRMWIYNIVTILIILGFIVSGVLIWFKIIVSIIEPLVVFLGFAQGFV